MFNYVAVLSFHEQIALERVMLIEQQYATDITWQQSNEKSW